MHFHNKTEQISSLLEKIKLYISIILWLLLCVCVLAVIILAYLFELVINTKLLVQRKESGYCSITLKETEEAWTKRSSSVDGKEIKNSDAN